MRRFAFFALAGCVAACGIGVAGVDPSTSTVGTESGGAVTPSDAGAPAPADANVLTPIDGGCLRVIDDSFSGATLDSRWRLAGNAKFQNGQVELTQSGDYMASGALWWTETLVFGKTLTAHFHYSQLVEAPNNPGVGVAIGWVKSNPTWTLGDQGLNVGICNSKLDGVAASLRLSGGTRLDAIAGVHDECVTNGGFTPATAFDLASGILGLKLTPALVTAMTDDHDTKQAAVVPTSGVIGFTASTGTSSAGEGRFAITHATVEVCP
jgi:hypothetical protein